MPKIDAPTVAEHRALKERAIVAATVDLLVGQGQDAVTPAAVAERTGLARTSVYQYHSSAASLVAAAVEELFRLAEVEIAEALAGVGDDPIERLSAYVSAMLRIALAGHSPSRSISLDGAPDACRARIRTLHDQALMPLSGIVADLGSGSILVKTALASGTIQGAVQMVEHGADIASVTALTTEFLRKALQSGSCG